MITASPERLDRAYHTALSALLAERTPEGHWVGELSTSALSTATAISALALVQKHVPPHDQYAGLIDGGLRWLATNQNADGGWGDTVKSFSNISTTMLCRAALYLTGAAKEYADTLRQAEAWLAERYGRTPAELAEAVRARYGKDRTFAVPILTTCALAGLVPWREVPPLPFELACLPQSWFRFLRLHVVSYALPALIAIGQAVYHHRPPWNPVARLARRFARRKSLWVLELIQPSSGGYLEATPLTSFVVLSLASIGQGVHPVARKGSEFLANSVRPDGSWAIDSNLATWVTTLGLNALSTSEELVDLDKSQVKLWLFRQQCHRDSPHTAVNEFGWAWTDLPGGVPDADDTSGAILAMNALAKNASEGVPYAQIVGSVLGGLRWLENLQNADGGWPTFCRGWTNLPFDRSGADLTAHALRAIACWPQLFHLKSGPVWKAQFENHFIKLIPPALGYLSREQQPDGSWLPLWFGNQHAPDDANPTYGTARVLAAYRDLDMMTSEPARRGVAWLLAAQNDDGGWGGAKGCPSSVEETALAVELLLDAPQAPETVVNRGLAWLVQRIEAGGLYDPTPIGFYFAKLWYFEKLYPIIFSVAALGRARRKLAGRRELARPEPSAS